MRPLRISAISYLNTAPLMWDLLQPGTTPDFEISYTIPSLCAAALRNGSADIGIIPAIAYTSIPDLVIIPDVAIAAKGPVRSILLVSKQPLEQIKTVATDSSSLSSVGLAHVLFEHWFGGGREFRSMPPDLPSMLQVCDAALIIGDPALKIDRSQFHVLDLAEEWRRLSGKPFVFAFWAVRGAALDELRSGLDLASIFQDSRDHGLEPSNLQKICREWAGRLGLSEADVHSYLTQSIHYFLDRECQEGMQLFFRLAEHYGIIPSAPALRFLEPVTNQLIAG
jgi:chorismate dehydratase